MREIAHRATCVIIALSVGLLSVSAADAAKKKKKTFDPGKARWEIKTTTRFTSTSD
jgi:hypothetical protein